MESINVLKEGLIKCNIHVYQKECTKYEKYKEHVVQNIMSSSNKVI